MTASSTSPRGVEGEDRPRLLRRGGPRVLVVSFAISAAIHAAVILLYPVLLRRAHMETPATRQYAPVSRFRATQGVRLVEVPEEPRAPEEAPPREETPEPEPKPVEQPAEEPTFPEEEQPTEEALPPTAAERLRPGEADPRIWRPVAPERVEPTQDERARMQLEGRLQAWNDSVSAAELHPNMDWTYTDDKGRRWGLSPGELHLGPLTLPMPSFWGNGSGAGNLQKTLREQWEVEDIEQGAAQARVRETLKQRGKAIRERKDKERKAKADTTHGGGGG